MVNKASRNPLPPRSNKCLSLKFYALKHHVIPELANRHCLSRPFTRTLNTRIFRLPKEVRSETRLMVKTQNRAALSGQDPPVVPDECLMGSLAEYKDMALLRTPRFAPVEDNPPVVNPKQLGRKSKTQPDRKSKRQLNLARVNEEEYNCRILRRRSFSNEQSDSETRDIYRTLADLRRPPARRRRMEDRASEINRFSPESEPNKAAPLNPPQDSLGNESQYSNRAHTERNDNPFNRNPNADSRIEKVPFPVPVKKNDQIYVLLAQGYHKSQVGSTFDSSLHPEVTSGKAENVAQKSIRSAINKDAVGERRVGKLRTLNDNSNDPAPGSGDGGLSRVSTPIVFPGQSDQYTYHQPYDPAFYPGRRQRAISDVGEGSHAKRTKFDEPTMGTTGKQIVSTVVDEMDREEEDDEALGVTPGGSRLLPGFGAETWKHGKTEEENRDIVDVLLAKWTVVV
ncbi:hypothetical protein K504DRAFT_528810 [Pleomassaria siparia CBS 279.74]|uniref:Uncharacterized protein n=1 Tax=Pleomassaria siparia CBS 279.74 TaxID=1314801 RepID=A0A6G1KNU5_9PLEO|nr:hypothetical protein K504DRAFT_528810 [Pleomassaria siparia CBS 279.74]